VILKITKRYSISFSLFLKKINHNYNNNNNNNNNNSNNNNNNNNKHDNYNIVSTSVALEIMQFSKKLRLVVRVSVYGM